MYIHGYQIHNVLNAYRKQLSQPAETSNTTAPEPKAHDDRIDISADGQRQSVFDKISTEIVNRITQFDASNRFDAVMRRQLALHPSPRRDGVKPEDSEFSYNVIDEHNRKITNTLPLQRLNPMDQPPLSVTETEDGNNHQTKKE